MKNTLNIFYLSWTLLITGCESGIENVNDNELEAAIGKILLKHPVCIGGSDFNVFPFGYRFKFPQQFEMSNNLPLVLARIKVYDKFNKANILKKVTTNGKIIYDLSVEGRKILKDGRFCYGVKKISRIISYKIKNKARKLIQVNYGYKLVSQQWIKHPEFTSVYDNQTGKNEQQASQFLVLSSNKWISPAEMNFSK